MLALPVIISLVVGILLAEAMRRVVAWRWPSAGLQEILTLPRAFEQAKGDDARQALLLRTGRITLIYSLFGLALFTGLAALVYLPSWTLDWSVNQNAAYLVMVSVVAALWWLLRRAPSAKKEVKRTYGNYSPLQRWLHWLALEPAVVRHLAFDLERQFALPKQHSQDLDPSDGAVYVCGLARSGTTILLRVLDQVAAFKSLSYRDMPFVLAPNLWRRIVLGNATHAAATERAHGDGILVDFDSPEAFEEVFWRTFGIQRLSKDSIDVEQPSPEAMANFADYRALVANPKLGSLPRGCDAKRYLSKNNNNLLRLDALSADPTATVLLVYRDPLATARSLHRQHLRYCALQKQDTFAQRYMGWLGHYEFGLDHRPFAFASYRMDKSYTPTDLNYWLDYWNAVYSHVLSQSYLRVHLVNHTVLCAQPTASLEALFHVLGVTADIGGLATLLVTSKNALVQPDEFAPELVQKALSTHRSLQASNKNLLATFLLPQSP